MSGTDLADLVALPGARGGRGAVKELPFASEPLPYANDTGCMCSEASEGECPFMSACATSGFSGSAFTAGVPEALSMPMRCFVCHPISSPCCVSISSRIILS